MGKIFYLLGKSGSGKDSIYKELMDMGLGLKPVVLYTTRPMRDGEKEGIEYHFIDDEEFERLRDADKLIEYREYNTVCGIWRYMTVDDGQIDISRNSFLMIGTLESYEKMLTHFEKDALCPIYLTVDDGERLMRALARERQQSSPKYAELCRRYLADEKDFSPERLAECHIDRSFKNDDFKRCLNEIADYIRSLRHA